LRHKINRKFIISIKKVSIKAGANVFTIRPKKGNTVIVGKFAVVRDGQKENIAVNGDFALPTEGTLIPGW
jgi:hypothetical protein